MPIWSIRCHCGGDTSTLTKYSVRVAQGNKVACSGCGALNTVRPTTPNLAGFGREKGLDGEVTTSTLRAMEKDGKVIQSPHSKERREQFERARAGADAQAQKMGFRDVDDFNVNWKYKKRDWNRDRQAQQINDYHNKHGNANRQTVEQAFGPVK